MRSPRTATKSSPRLPQLEKARAKQQSPNAAKKKLKKKDIPFKHPSLGLHAQLQIKYKCLRTGFWVGSVGANEGASQASSYLVPAFQGPFPFFQQKSFLNWWLLGVIHLSPQSFHHFPAVLFQQKSSGSMAIFKKNSNVKKHSIPSVNPFKMMRLAGCVGEKKFKFNLCTVLWLYRFNAII